MSTEKKRASTNTTKAMDKSDKISNEDEPSHQEMWELMQSIKSDSESTINKLDAMEANITVLETQKDMANPKFSGRDTSKKSTLPDTFRMDKEELTNPQTITDGLCNYFTEVEVLVEELLPPDALDENKEDLLHTTGISTN
ncbi:hypothetical protein LSH36_887g01014 [Paralvinella palmiformis]|uniref:Uncharacterized protein n=1 Tax=Paralvinella palmiformis TaxID=53620 RepID=A0AAD9IXZ4_9ANNE|nr:hypothetical protein LSH36_887g01014 [Paralvinella palmiformis]